MIHQPRIIAEIGTAHGGDLVKATELMHAAREAGADTAKFQVVRAREILHPRTGTVDLPGGPVPLYERFTELEQDETFYERLIETATEVGIGFLCSVFGIEGARMLKRLGADEIKIASPELNHLPLLREVSKYRLPLILSAGVATVADIAEALTTVGNQTALTLLHCVTAYPAPEEDYNLRVLRSLHQLFGVPVGVSDHSLDPVLVPALATLHGAAVIEKHITLHHEGGGLDDRIALEPAAFSRMVRAVRGLRDRLRIAADDNPLAHRSTELELEAQIREEYGDERVDAVLGSGVKTLAASEARNYGFTNRSIHALEELARGAVLTRANTAILRSERNLTPGLHPRHWETILGAALTRPIAAGEGITWSHLLTQSPE